MLYFVVFLSTFLFFSLKIYCTIFPTCCVVFSVLRVVLHCEALQCIPVHFREFPCIAVHSSAFKCIPVHSNAFQCIPVHYSAL